ncbi:MAG TPA: hypothetical protein VIK53_03815 [Verrucomicrobiae bacterium]
MNEPAAIPKIAPLPPDAPVFERGLWGRTWFMILLCLVFLALDWELVPLQVFPFVFIFPVMLVAWNRPLWLSTVCAGALSTTRILHELVFSLNSRNPVSAEELADTLICFFVLQLLAVLTMLLARQSRQLRRRVQALEGLLPICSFCKSIRNDRDEWVQIEKYIIGHTEATFSHGLCPDCARKHYGEFFPPKKKD